MLFEKEKVWQIQLIKLCKNGLLLMKKITYICRRVGNIHSSNT